MDAGFNPPRSYFKDNTYDKRINTNSKYKQFRRTNRIISFIFVI